MKTVRISCLIKINLFLTFPNKDIDFYINRVILKLGKKVKFFPKY